MNPPSPTPTTSPAFNSHVDKRLTKEGGMSLDVWMYVLRLECKAHDDVACADDARDWVHFYDDDYTPHAALEEEFNNG